MHDDDSPRRDAPRGPREDEIVERAVLAYVLAHHPARVTLKELTDEIAGSKGEREERAVVQRAVAELIAVGLLRPFGDAVLPSLAALRFDSLGL